MGEGGVYLNDVFEKYSLKPISQNFEYLGWFEITYFSPTLSGEILWSFY